MTKKYVLAHDLGTTGDKAVLFDVEAGRIVGNAFASYDTYYPAATWAEQDPRDWWRAFCMATREVLTRNAVPPQDIAVLAFAGQMMGCLPVAENGAPLRKAIIWADQRATSEARGLVERLGLEKVYRITGHRVGPAYSAPKFMWLKTHEPRIYEKVHKFLQAKDFIVHKLTGRWVTDYSDACGTGLLDIRSRDWSEEILAAVGIPRELLPDPVPSIAVVGEVGKEAAEEAGLAPGTPVVIGGGDGVCATAGAGVIQPGIGHVYLGSSAWVAGASKEPVFDPKMRTFTWPHLDPNLYSPNGTMHNAGASLDWAGECFGSLEKRVADWLEVTLHDLMEWEAERIPAGSEGLIFLPYLMGERSPHWNPNARGVFFGITRKHRKAHFVRAVYEGVSLNLRTIFLALKELGVKFTEVRLIGGGAKSRLWTQILADTLGTTIRVVQAPLEATALGAAMAGAVGVELVPDFRTAAERFVGIGVEVKPGPEMATYARLHELFVYIYDALLPVFDLLSEVMKGGKDGEA